MPSLLIESADGVVGTVLIDKETLTMGRRDDCDIILADVNASRCHAKITMKSDTEFTVEDMGSHNGTIVNDEEAEGVHTLQDKDQIKIGNHRITFFTSDEPPVESSEGFAADAAPRGVMTFEEDDDGQLGDMLRGMLDKAKTNAGSEATMTMDKSPMQGIQEEAAAGEKKDEPAAAEEAPSPQAAQQKKTLALIIGLVVIAIIIVILAIFLPSLIGNGE